MGRIALLSDELINQIAAGEVVERPASVVKELCENSLDAGARVIRVSLREGGLGAIGVTDDGYGMSRQDAVLCLERHATSKLRSLEGLFEISTMGFRGEALPSMAAVSRFSLRTGESGAAEGTAIRIEGTGEREVSATAPLQGTHVAVEDLFFNTPARRKFMRREQTERAHCMDAVLRLALSHPAVSFFVEHEGHSLLASPACGEDFAERIATALGLGIREHLLRVDERRLGIRVHGYVASPEFTLPTARGLYTFVNRRYVRDRGLNHAIQRAFQDGLPPGRQPVAVVFVELDPRAVDVNAHPQKLEIRFADARSAHDAVLSAVSVALGRSPWLSERPSEVGVEPLAGAHYALAVERFLARAAEPSLPFGATGSDSPAAQGDARAPGFFKALLFLGALGGRFWVCEGPGGSLVVLDSHAAQERVRRAELEAAIRRPTQSLAQDTLFRTTVELPAKIAPLVAARLPALAALGFAVEPFGGSSFVVSSAPPALLGADHRVLLCELAELLPREDRPLDAVTLAPALTQLACRAASHGAAGLTPDQVCTLICALERSSFAPKCAHGRVVLTETPYLELLQRAEN